MTSFPWTAGRHICVARAEAALSRPPRANAASGTALNTILAVREHAPAEIAELERDIQTLHHRINAAYARKRLLEQLIRVINDADAEQPIAPGIVAGAPAKHARLL